MHCHWMDLVVVAVGVVNVDGYRCGFSSWDALSLNRFGGCGCGRDI